MKLTFSTVLFLCVSVIYCQNLEYQLVIGCYGNVKYSITNKSDNPLKYIKDGSEHTLNKNFKYEGEIFCPMDELKFINLKVYPDHIIEYKFESNFKGPYEICDQGEISCYESKQMYYKVFLDDNNVLQYKEQAIAFNPEETNALYFNSISMLNSNDRNNNVVAYIKDSEVNDTLKCTLATVNGFMGLNFYQKYLDITMVESSSELSINFDNINSGTERLSSCCSLSGTYMEIYPAVKYIEFPYLHELMHYFKVDGDYDRSDSARFILLPNEKKLKNHSFVSIRSNEKLFTNKFKMDLITISEMYNGINF